MVCRTCQEAALLARDPEKIIYQDLWSGSQRTMSGPEAAALVHLQCRGGTFCDCQHVVRELARPK